jgi:hypothetical protein
MIALYSATLSFDKESKVATGYKGQNRVEKKHAPSPARDQITVEGCSSGM